MTRIKTGTFTYYTPAEIDEAITEFMQTADTVRGRDKITYYNTPVSFDIETTSFTDSAGDKAAIMYEWTLGLNGAVVIGRTWEEFDTVFMELTRRLYLDETHRLRIYVHNLAFEFQFMFSRFEWIKVFATDTRKPVNALTTTGIEFRCSFLLSGYPLAALGGQLQRYKAGKASGDLNYSLIRHAETPLTRRELHYCIMDVIVVNCYIQEQLENCGGINMLQMTKTGVVRDYCRKCCLGRDKDDKTQKRPRQYRELIKTLTLNPDVYRLLKRGFQGGFTHANGYKAGKLWRDVQSYDFTSSYPAVMLSERFPMSAPERVDVRTREQFTKLLQMYCCIFEITFYNIESFRIYERPLSRYRCSDYSRIHDDNGRVISADRVTTVLTEQDFFIMQQFYKWDDIAIGEFYTFKKGYLPRPFAESILKLYKDKTQLKGVAGREYDYLISKGMLNSAYGMAVTDIIRDEQIFNGELWYTEPADPETALSKYNKNIKRFLYYAWGVWVTAYARRNLFTGILEAGTDYIYSDTDSIKLLNGDAHAQYFEAYNKNIQKKLQRAMEFYGLPVDDVAPATIKGVKKPLGVWDREHDILLFKTLGAKRYLLMTREELRDGSGRKITGPTGKPFVKYNIELTVAGVNKNAAVPYLIDKYGKYGTFAAFSDGLNIPAGFTGKMIHEYIDAPREGFITDYTGITSYYNERSGVHLQESEYELSISREYLNIDTYLNKLFNTEEIDDR